MRGYSARTLGHEVHGMQDWDVKIDKEGNTYLHMGKRRSVRKQLTVTRDQLKWTCFERMSCMVNTLTRTTPSALVANTF